MRRYSLQLPKVRMSSGLLSHSAAHQPGCDVAGRFQGPVAAGQCCWSMVRVTSAGASEFSRSQPNEVVGKKPCRLCPWHLLRVKICQVP